MDGDHSIEACYDVTARTLTAVFEQLDSQAVALEGIVLKPNMVISGLGNADRAGVEQVAKLTLRCLGENVPAAVPGIAFLSGGQGDVEATEHLNLMNQLDTGLPWELTFSYGRALQRKALETWSGQSNNVSDAQAELMLRARLNSLAAGGAYTPELEMAA